MGHSELCTNYMNEITFNQHNFEQTYIYLNVSLQTYIYLNVSLNISTFI